MINQIHLGNNLDILKTFPDNFVDSIVTDPPYGLGFMGKQWDTFDKNQFGKAGEEGKNDLKLTKNFNILPRYGESKDLYKFSLEWAKECLRVLKPGGHLLSFGGTRTYHRMVCAIEDAGFEIRDMIEWVYGCGFPKSLNIGKAVARLQGENIPKTKGFNVAGQGIGLNPNKQLRSDHPKYVKPFYHNEFDGWGSSLKPAHEPICVARKPLSEKTIAQNVLKYGTGGMNIDISRIPTNDDIDRNNGGTEVLSWGGTYGAGKSTNQIRKEQGLEQLGRFPANLIHDGSDEVKECFPETKSQQSMRGAGGGGDKVQQLNYRENSIRGHNDSGNASRFFKSIIYTPKASKSERNMGLDNFEEKIVNDGRKKDIDNAFQRGITLRLNIHPTVKPIALMEYLVKLVTPKGGVVLDPFAGSGTTLIAAKNLGFDYIGIELNEEYVAIANARLNSVEPQLVMNL